MDGNEIFAAELNQVKAVEMKSGFLTRRTLTYNDQMMLCHFTMKKGLKLELHKHLAVQAGYVIKGKVRFIRDDGTSIIATAGTSYLFASNEVHGIDEVFEPTELIEIFSPMRPEYV